MAGDLRMCIKEKNTVRTVDSRSRTAREDRGHLVAIFPFLHLMGGVSG